MQGLANELGIEINVHHLPPGTSKVRCELDTGQYPKGVAVTDQEMAEINIHLADLHGEWSYTIKPNERRLDRAVDS